MPTKRFPADAFHALCVILNGDWFAIRHVRGCWLGLLDVRMLPPSSGMRKRCDVDNIAGMDASDQLRNITPPA